MTHLNIKVGNVVIQAGYTRRYRVANIDGADAWCQTKEFPGVWVIPINDLEVVDEKDSYMGLQVRWVS